MSWRAEFAMLGGVCFAVAGMAAGCVDAKGDGVCTARPDDPARQLYLFDGDPAGRALLAPDDEQTAPNTYSVGPIYDRGRYVTVRCEYKSGASHDVQLKEKVSRCEYSEGDTGPNLRCK